MSESAPADDPQTFVCVVEIPKGTRNKYEYDEELGGIKFDRLLWSAATYPTDYGYLRDTLALDGDELDVLVCLTEPTFPGCLIEVKPIGMFVMSDEKGPDEKILCVPVHDPYWNHYDEVQQLPQLLLQEIDQFFSIYKELEPNKTVEISGWRPRRDALREIAECRQRFSEQSQV
ncbi:MAG TPA: inorganic diphosphatase [Solirubrobacteraceae bacterium]|jgi:inorganic pyrophosphatase